MGSRDFCHAGYWAEGVLSSVRWETGLSLAGSRAWPVLLLCLVRCSAGGSGSRPGSKAIWNLRTNRLSGINADQGPGAETVPGLFFYG